MAGPDALIFDLDGTLVDTLADITASARHTVATAIQRPITPADVKPWVSHGARALLANLIGSHDSEEVGSLVARFREHYQLHGLDHSRLYDGWPEVLDELAVRGVPMCVLSNKPHASTQWICGALLARWPFREVVGLREGVPAKPDPTGVLELVRKLGTKPDRVALLGDSPLDAGAALAAGCRAVGVGWGFHEADELTAAGSETVLRAPAELLELLDIK